MADPASVLEICGASLFVRFRNLSSPLRKREATAGTVRPIRSETWGRVQPRQRLSTTTSRIRSGRSASSSARQHLFVPLVPAAGRGLVGGQPGGKAGGGAVEVGLERSLKGDVPLVQLVVLHRVRLRGAPSPLR